MVRNRHIYIKQANVDGKGDKSFFLVHHFKIDPASPKYFKNDYECLFSNEENKYSLLGYINDQFRVQGSFVFLLEYPETPCHYFFSQEVNPIFTTPDNVEGFTPYSSNCSSNLKFIGLNRNNYQNAAYLDGIVTNPSNSWYWFFGIGQKTTWGGHDQIPGYISSYSPIILEVNLWMQFDDPHVLYLLHQYFTCNSCVRFLYFHLISCSFFITFFSN